MDFTILSKDDKFERDKKLQDEDGEENNPFGKNDTKVKNINLMDYGVVDGTVTQGEKNSAVFMESSSESQ